MADAHPPAALPARAVAFPFRVSFTKEPVMRAIIILILVLAFCLPAFAQDAPDPAAYCTAQGGEVVARVPGIVAGDALTPVGIPGSFCEWTSAEDGSRVSVAMPTLTSANPTLAAIAYHFPPAFESLPDMPSANPSYVYCAQLGGAITFVAAPFGMGEWVNEADAADRVTMCVFADGSMMDSFGLFYRSADVARGADLRAHFVWQADGAFEELFGAAREG
jgi:putative hemolysin